MPARSPEETCRLFREAIRKGDLESALAIYDPEAALLNRDGVIKEGATGLREELAPFAAARADFDFYIKRVIRAGDIALLHTLWNVTMPGEQLSLYAIEVARRQPDGTWRWLIGDPFTIGGNGSSTVYARPAAWPRWLSSLGTRESNHRPARSS
ncbi:MAG TPA: nuclear transport factor 2 family protein [Thermoanaerobaculia bacterium]|nr:nuclear transport factor 2 family protein [Thermoanaerobaculia bacterium]